MSILSGFLKTKKHRKMADGNYKLQSEWTSSETVEMADGNTAEENLGSIKGITSSLASTDSGYALSASAGKDLQDQVTENKNNINTLNSNLNNKANTSTVTALQTSVNTINSKLEAGYVGKSVTFKYTGAWENVDTGSFKLMYIISDEVTPAIIIPCKISTGSSAVPYVVKTNSGTSIFQYFISGTKLYVYVLKNGSTVGVNFIL